MELCKNKICPAKSICTASYRGSNCASMRAKFGVDYDPDDDFAGEQNDADHNQRYRCWVVSYYDNGKMPVVTVFNNKDAAMLCYQTFLGAHDKVDVDECPIYGKFSVGNDQG